MNKNFEIRQGVELVREGHAYDLHNCYVFGGIAVTSSRRAAVWFMPDAEFGSDQPAIVIEVTGISTLELSAGVARGAARDVDELGYKAPDDRDLEWLIAESQARDGDHMVLRLLPDDFLRIDAASLELREASPRDLPLFAACESR